MQEGTNTMKTLSMFLVMGVVIAATPLVASAGDVTPEVIFGSGNSNGSWTIDRANGVELALRGKLRHNASGLPENTFNWDGAHTYTFNPGVAPTQSFPTAEWSFEWSINSDYLGTFARSLDDLTYELSMTSTTGVSFVGFDPINGVNPGVGVGAWDHAIGDNSTPNGGGSVAANAPAYASLIGANNVAQNSWKPHWFSATFNPETPGDYFFTLKAFDGSTQIAQTDMTVTVVPLPPAAWMGLGLLGGLGLLRRRRRRDA